jgi:site-specific DNA-methyltransferase (adenine-specific)
LFSIKHHQETMMSADQAIIDSIITGDCRDVLQTLPEKSVDLIFADPPYNLQLEKELWRPNITKVNGVDESWDKFSGFEAYDQFTENWLSGCRSVLKDTGTIWVIGSYHNIFRVGRIMQDLGYWILNDIIWIKNNPMPNFHGVRFTNAHETLIWAQKSKGNRYTFNYNTMKNINTVSQVKAGLQMRSDWRLPLCTGKERLKINGEKAHPTQKPEALLERVILSSSQPGEIVLDPFFGTGTTGAVAKKLGRHWIGIELEPQYTSIAQLRISAVSYSAESINALSKRVEKKRKRIPFIRLLQEGWLKSGQVLYFGRDGNQKAIILPDGQIKSGELSGSIHKVGRELMKAPCNGWMTWYYTDDESGNLKPIDALRERIRNDRK